MLSPQKKYAVSKKGRATKRAYFLANKERIAKKKQAWRKKYPSKESGYYAKMKRLHPLKIEKKNFQSRVLLSGILMTFEEYKELKKRHGGKCGICRKPNKSNRELCIDHDHATGKVRGLLCSRCNLGIGLLGDTLQSVKDAAAYLKRSI